MGRRSRKRSALTAEERREAIAAREGDDAPRQAVARRRASGGRARRDAVPPAPWHPFPLVELCVLIALGLGIGGFVVGGNRGGIMLAGAAAVGSLAGLEISIREHFAGYRSHTAVLAGAAAVVVAGAFFFARAPWVLVVAPAVAVFGVTFWRLRHAYKRRSGALGAR
ncbi:MAG TPA: hypothetical protein VHE14_06280 [Solirubrobacteraceae bacterium]|nr:hypothetical protein [Solirubrobacteraceae bacterium]